PIFVFSFNLEHVFVFLLSLSFGLDFILLPFFSSFPSTEALGKFSGLITRGILRSPRSFAFAMASDIIRLAFSCLLSDSTFFLCFFSDMTLTWVFCNLVYVPEPSLSLTLPLGLFTEDIFGVRQRLALCFFTTPGSAQEKSIERRFLNGLFSKLQPRDAQPSTNTHFDLSTHFCLSKFISTVHSI
ncbi:hypothetical protein H8957_016492, partial [Semnopithecus entellus]